MKKKKENNEQSCNHFPNSIIESSPIPIIAVDTNGKVSLWNKAAEGTFGWKQSEIISKSNPIIPKDRKEEFKDLLSKSLKGESVVDFKTKRKCKDGSIIDVSISTSAWRDAKGNIIGGIAQMIDITDRLKSENELKEKEKELETIFNSSGDALFIHDLQGRMIMVNDEACRRLGYTKEELVNLTPLDLDSDKYKPAVKHRITEISKNKSVTFETEHVTKNGKVIPTEIKSTSISLNKQKAILSIARDISDRKKSEFKLKESEERFRNAVVLAPNPIMIHDKDNNVLQLSNGWTKYSGYNQEDIPTLYDWTEKAYGNRSGFEKEYIDKLFEIEGTVNNGEWKVNCKNGETRIWEFFTTPLGISGDGKKVLLSIAFDLTDKKKAEEELKQSEEKYREFFMKDLTGDFLTTVDGNMIDCNPAFLKIMDYESIEELKQHSLLSLYKNKDDRDELVELVKEKKETSNYETSLVRKSGEEIHVLENVVGVFDDKGNLTHLRGYIFDITDRKVAEERLQHVHSLLYAIRNVNQLIVTEKNIDNLMRRSCEILLEGRGYYAVWIGLTNDSITYDKLFSFGMGKDIDKFIEQLKNGIIPPCLNGLSLNKPVIKCESVEDFCTDCVIRPAREGKGVIISLIKHLDNVYGTLYIISENIDVFTEEEESLIEEVSGDLGLAIFIQQEEQKREIAETRLQNAIDIIPEVISIVNNEGRINYLNKAGLKMIKAEAKDVLGKKPIDVIPKPIADIILPQQKKVFETKAHQKTEAIIELGDEKRWFIFEHFPLFDNNGDVKEIFGTARDITESKTYEQKFIQLAEGVASKVGEEFFDVLVENLSKTLSADVVLIGKVNDDNINMINTLSVFKFNRHVENFSYDLTGAPCENVVNKKLCSYEKDVTKIFPSDQILIDLEIEGYIGTPLWDSKGNAIGILVCLFKSPIKNVKIKESIIHVFGLRASGEIERLEYLSEILKQRDELKESESKFRSFVENAFDGIYVMKETHYEYVNKRFCELTGYTEKELTSRDFNFEILLTEKSLGIVKERYEARKLGKVIPQTYETELKSKDGIIHEVDVSTVKIGKKDDLRILGFMHDITERNQATKKIKESEKRFRSITQTATDAIVTADSYGKIIGWNPSAEKIFGYSAEEALNKLLSLIIPSGYRKQHLTGMNRVAGSGEHRVIGKTIELEGLHKNGKIFPIELSLAEWESTGEKFYTGIIRDISERKNSERKIRDFADQYKTILSNMLFGYLLVDERGNIIDANETYCIMSEYSREELLHLTISDIEAIEKKEETDARIKKIIEVGRDKFETKHKTKSGRIYNVEVSISYWKYQARFISFLSDISERKRTEEEIKKFSKGVEQSSASIVITDIEGDIEYVNKKFTAITGYTFNEVIGKNPRILKSEENDPNIYKELWTTIKAGKEWRGELCNKKKSGELFWESESISPIVNTNGEITHFIAVKDDVTEQKKLVEKLTEARKKAEAADKMKSEFLAQMSHEIRSPLNAVLSFTNIIKEETSEIKSEDLEISFSAIDSASKRIIRTIDLILNMTDLQLGTYIISKRIIDLTELLRNLIMEYNSIAEAKKLDLRFSNEFEKVEIETDDYAVNQIFANLIDNAIKYTQEGFIEIRLLKESVDKYIVEIEDSGIGISEEYLPKLFSPFSQEEQGYSRKFEGTGLGMALVKKYCGLIGAEISVKSKKDVGTTFTVIF